MENGKPDRLDLQIIRQLREDGRRPTKVIAANLDVTEATVTARIRSLNEAGVMRVMAQRNVDLLRNHIPGFVSVWVRGRNIDEVADDLAALEETTSVNVMVGSPELQVTVFAGEHSEAFVQLLRLIGGVAGVDRAELDIGLATRTFRSDYGTLTPGALQGVGTSVELDDRIIHQLQIDGRVSNREIGRILDVPASTIRERVNRMLQAKAIRIGAICDARKLGFSLAAMAYLRAAPSSLETALTHLQGLEDMGAVSAISGRYGIFTLFAARDHQHLVVIVKSKLEVTPGLQEIDVRLIADTKKHRADLISIVPTAD